MLVDDTNLSVPEAIHSRRTFMRMLRQVDVTLWGDTANKIREEDLKGNPVVACKTLQVSDYNGKLGVWKVLIACPREIAQLRLRQRAVPQSRHEGSVRPQSLVSCDCVCWDVVAP